MFKLCINNFKIDNKTFDEIIASNDYVRFHVAFVDYYFEIIEYEPEPYETGRPSYDDKEMFKLVSYAYSQGITSSVTIEEYARYHLIYRFASNGIAPSQATIRKFIREKGYLFKPMMGCSLIFAQDLGLTKFEYLAIDGTIKKSNNNKYNVMDKKTINTLISYYSGKVLPKKKIKKLPRPGIKFIERTDMNDEDKLELLHQMKTQLKLSGQNTVPVNDIEARWMLNKKGNKEPSFNIQTAVDTMAKLICAVQVSQNATDHYLLPDIVEEAIKNTEIEPEYISADTGYHTKTSMEYLQNKEIKGLIPTRKQTRKSRKKLSENPFHKDHFKYDYDRDLFICPNKQELPFYKEILKYKDNEEEPYKVERRYMNYYACKDCKDQDKCHKSTARQITEFTTLECIEIRELMDSEEGKELYKQRGSTVEAPFGTLKVKYNIDNMPITGREHIENILSLFALTYNLKRIYNILHDINTKSDDIDVFVETMEILLNLDCTIKEVI